MKLFVFPLENVVFFPTSSVPLNIFEPRYLEMVREAMATSTPIALSQLDPTDPEAANAVRAGRKKQGIIAGYGLATLVREREDGSMIILLKGEGKARLTEVTNAKPFITCQAEPIEELMDEVGEGQRDAMARLNRILLRWIETNVEDAEQKRAFLANVASPRKALEALSMCLVPDPDVQQAILEIDTLDDRIRFMKFLF